MDEYTIGFCIALRERRIELGMSQGEVAASAGKKAAYYGHVERGEQSPSVVNVARIAHALDLTPGELFARVDRIIIRRALDGSQNSPLPLGARPAPKTASRRAPYGADKRRILETVAARPGITAATLARAIGRPRTAIASTMTRMKSREGLLEPYERGVRLTARGREELESQLE